MKQQSNLGVNSTLNLKLHAGYTHRIALYIHIYVLYLLETNICNVLIITILVLRTWARVHRALACALCPERCMGAARCILAAVLEWQQQCKSFARVVPLAKRQKSPKYWYGKEFFDEYFHNKAL